MKQQLQKFLMNNFFYLNQRGISEENAITMIVNGFCKEVLKELPMEFAEAKRTIKYIT